MKIVHYLNQFYGQIGGEKMAGIPLTIREEAIGPGLAFASQLKNSGCEIVATIICGDNYFSEHVDEVKAQLKEIISKYRPQLVIAGPAFNAGRYGMACGEVLKVARDLHIDAITAMNEENPGVNLYKLYGYILPCTANARGMGTAVTDICRLVRKKAKGQKIGSPEEEGYFPRGVRKNVFYKKNGAERAVDMLLKKLNNEPFKTELEMPVFSKVPPSAPITDMKNAVIALVTSGGIVPTGNPDHLEALAATKFVHYSADDFGGEEMKNCDVAHGGYDPTFAIGNGNRVLPVDALMELKRRGVIKDLFPDIYVTVGNGMPVDRAAAFGQAIGKALKGKVDGVLLTST